MLFYINQNIVIKFAVGIACSNLTNMQYTRLY